MKSCTKSSLKHPACKQRVFQRAEGTVSLLRPCLAREAGQAALDFRFRLFRRTIFLGAILTPAILLRQFDPLAGIRSCPRKLQAPFAALEKRTLGPRFRPCGMRIAKPPQSSRLQGCTGMTESGGVSSQRVLEVFSHPGQNRRKRPGLLHLPQKVRHPGIFWGVRACLQSHRLQTAAQVIGIRQFDIVCKLY